jgi:acyl-CoA thioesterase-1
MRGVLNRAVALLLTLLAAVSVAEARPLTLVALGDSLTQGYGLPEGEGLVPQLQAWLAARGHEITVVNAGVSGDTTAGGLARVEWTLAGGGDAMVVALGGNDLLRGIDPAVSRANLRGILQAAAARSIPVLLVGLPAPGNYGPEFKRDFEAMYPELAAEFGALHLADLLDPVTARAAEPGAAMRLMQPDGLHPSAAGVALIVEALGPAVEALIARVGG